MNMVIKERASLVEAVMAFVLLITNYQNKGYVSGAYTFANLRTLLGRFCDYIGRVRDYNNTPSKGQVLVAKKHGLVVGTLSACFNPRTTPIDDIFPDELNALHTSNESFVYLGSFAVAPSYQGTRLCMRMIRTIWSLAKKRGVDRIICVVHPDHSKFYQRLGFTEVAVATMSGLQSAPAALLVVSRQDVRL
jgi:predicted N-acetyltransferase YhbS